MESTVVIPKQEYDDLRVKAELFEHYVQTEEINGRELSRIKRALKGPFIAQSEFLRRHPSLN